MSFLSWVQRFFVPPVADEGDPLADAEADLRGLQWTQNTRLMLAIVIVILSAFVVFWIMA